VLFSVARSKQIWTLRHARKPCRTAQSCCAFNRRSISRFPRNLCVRHCSVMAPRHRVLLLKECIAGTVVGSLQGMHYSEPSFPTEAGPRYKWEDYECSHCHVGFPTRPFGQLTISPIAYLRSSSLCVQSQGFLAPRANPQIPPAPCGGGLRLSTKSVEPCARTERTNRDRDQKNGVPTTSKWFSPPLCSNFRLAR
jgi:hypothetical protein